MALINEVYEYIENKYKPNEPIFLAELDIPDMKPISVRQQMKKLTEEGRRLWNPTVPGKILLPTVFFRWLAITIMMRKIHIMHH